MTKDDVYANVTERVIQALEEGTVPWRKPWSAAGVPVNVRTGRPYRGVNVLLLGLTEHSDPRWGTYKAMRECGGQVRKGEKATAIVLWKPVTRKGENENGELSEHGYLLARCYNVFNAEQCDGLPELELSDQSEYVVNDRAEEVINGYKSGPALLHGGDRACYSPAKDLVRMPEPESFSSSPEYYQTLFHELIHSTGHESRLARLEPALFGSDPYAKEELIAELGASMLAGLIGLETSAGENSAAYIANWLEALRNDRKLIISAAAAAQKASDRIVGDTFAVATPELELEQVAA
jgi:antirestriction protein ArdC